jgi:hypothetical protein
MGQLRGQEVQIILEDDNPIIRWPYRLNEMERASIQAQKIKLLDANLVELSRGDYVSTTMMLTKKVFFGN